MTKEQAIDIIKCLAWHARPDEEQIEQAIKSLEQQSEDCKIFSTKENCFGGADCENCDYKIQPLMQPTSDDCVSRAEVIDELNRLGRNAFKDDTDYDNFFAFVDSLPPVTPTHCIAAVRFSKDDLREICNERIKIECTHGTCKGCKHYYIDEDGHGYHCEKFDYTRFPVYADFYCADYEKRGNENESIN